MSKKKHLLYYYLFIFLILLIPCELLAENKIMTSIDKNSNSETDLSWTNLTLDEKIGQMIMIRMSGKFHNSSDYSIKDVKYLIDNFNVGGLIMFYGNVHGAAHNISLFQKSSISLPSK